MNIKAVSTIENEPGSSLATRYFETTALLGARYFKATQITPTQMEIKEVRIQETPFPQTNLHPLAEPARTAPSFLIFSTSALALARAQQKASGTLNPLIREETAKKPDVDPGLISANEVMLTNLKKGTPLDAATIENINYLASGNLLGTGVIRGYDKNRGMTYQGEGRFLVNLKQAEVSHGKQFSYIPAQHVPPRIERWIDEVNAMNTQTPLLKIATALQEFIVIHPFIDGNGRTSRVLLDYMLLKSGFPAIPHKSWRTGSVMHKTPVEIHNTLVESYKNLTAPR